MSDRRKVHPQPEIEFSIDMDDERVIEALARFLLDITRHRDDAASESHDDDQPTDTQGT